MNRTFLNTLAKTVDDFQSNCVQRIPLVTMATRTSVQESTGFITEFRSFGKKTNLLLVFTTLCHKNSKRPTCIRCPTKTCRHAKNSGSSTPPSSSCSTGRQPQILWNMRLCLTRNRNQVKVIGYIALSSPRD